MNLNLKSTNASSTKYGDCEICHKHCSEVWHAWFDNQIFDSFGHKDCLEARASLVLLLTEAKTLTNKARNRLLTAYAFADNDTWERERQFYFKTDRRFWRRASTLKNAREGLPDD